MLDIGTILFYFSGQLILESILSELLSDSHKLLFLFLPVYAAVLGIYTSLCPIRYAHKFLFLLFGQMYYHSLWICGIHLPLYFRVALLALGQSYDCPSASEVTLKDSGKITCTKPKAKPNKAQINCLHSSWDVCIIIGMYYKYAIVIQKWPCRSLI